MFDTSFSNLASRTHLWPLVARSCIWSRPSGSLLRARCRNSSHGAPMTAEGTKLRLRPRRSKSGPDPTRTYGKCRYSIRLSWWESSRCCGQQGYLCMARSFDRLVHAARVVGSIIPVISVMIFAGKPLISACFSIASRLSAR